jgi:plastocyanin
MAFASSNIGADPDMSIRFGIFILTALSLTACGSYSTPTAPGGGASGSTTTVSMVSGAFALTTTAFSPNPVNVAVGTTVTWTNNDSTTHDATANNGSFATGLIAPGRSASVTFQTAGTVAYRCTIHPGMVGTINVQ